jgi:hypothetical protein
MLPKFGLLLLGALLSIAICSHAAIVFNDPTLVAEKFNGQALFDYVVPFYPLGTYLLNIILKLKQRLIQ